MQGTRNHLQEVRSSGFSAAPMLLLLPLAIIAVGTRIDSIDYLVESLWMKMDY